MENINSLELKRKIAHILFGIIGLLLLTYNIFNSLILFIFLIIGIFASLLSMRFKIPVISFFLDNFERTKDKIELPGRGIIFAFAGAILALQLFEKNIALASITILIFADPISHLFGKYFGKTKSLLDNKKNIEGHITGALIRSIFGEKIFETPKPIELLVLLLKLLDTKDSIILDFFSGSGTTAHAVMQLNAEDGGNRKFICVQLPEVTDEKSEAHKAGYKNICEIGKERIRRAGKKIMQENALLVTGLDIGFRVFKLDHNNKKNKA